LAEGRGEGLFAGEIEVGDGAMTGTRDGETGGVIDGVAGLGVLHAVRTTTRSKKKRRLMIYLSIE
jgi:hypothetical protein